MAPRKQASKPAPHKDPLKDYGRKRDFTRTSEPKPEVASGEGWQFVVQKHDARRLHFDLRLELGGTLKSWAITRGPSLVAGEKRLAVRTEDHPMQYLDFEGVIPKGEYGGGSMIVWDRGRWTPVYDAEKGLKKGHLEFSLDGTRLKGRWHLVRMKPKPGEKSEPWLLIKAEDEHVLGPGQTEIAETALTSMLSGRTTDDVAAAGGLRADHAGRAKVVASRKRAMPKIESVKGARKGILPAFLEPSLPQVTARAPSGEQWVHEIKYDGYRIQARVDGGKVQLLTRKGLDWTKRFPNLMPALQGLGPSSALIDGEVVVEDPGGIPSFSLLQAELEKGRGDRFRYYMFDLLYCEGFDLTKVALVDRKALLETFATGLPAASPIRFSEHLSDDGPLMYEHACRLGLEGIVSKRRDLPYRAGRGDHWLKTKAVLRQEFVVLGYVPSTVAKGTVGALALGYYENGGLRYAGRVGTGYSAEESARLRVALDAIAAKKPKLGNDLPDGSEKGVRWAKPQLVCEIEFRGWSTDRLLRQASFKGLREDRPAEEITLEQVPAKPAAGQSRSPVARLTHPERLLWPERGVTKEGLAEFYADIASWILPHIAGRPLSLMRAPSGVGEKTFFAKHAWSGLGKSVTKIDVGEPEAMLTLDGLEGLMELVQASVVEIHPWGSKVDTLEQPDRLIFDLDPGEDVPWRAVIEAALEVRRRLTDLGLESFVKTSGGKGLHVVLPITPQAEWEEAKTFTHGIAKAMAKSRPGFYVATMSKSARHGKIFVDYLRNGRGSTAVAPYSTRATPVASVSTPLAWEELSEGIRPDHFKIGNLRQRLGILKDDPWARLFKVRQALPSPQSAG